MEAVEGSHPGVWPIFLLKERPPEGDEQSGTFWKSKQLG